MFFVLLSLVLGGLVSGGVLLHRENSWGWALIGAGVAVGVFKAWYYSLEEERRKRLLSDCSCAGLEMPDCVPDCEVPDCEVPDCDAPDCDCSPGS